MTLSDLWPGFQDHDIFWSHISEKRRILGTNLLAQECIPNISNGTMFSDLDWPLNALRGFVRISWACFSFPAFAGVAHIHIYLHHCNTCSLYSGFSASKANSFSDPLRGKLMTVVGRQLVNWISREEWLNRWGHSTSSTWRSLLMDIPYMVALCFADNYVTHFCRLSLNTVSGMS